MNIGDLDIGHNTELKAKDEGRRDKVLLNQTGEDTATLPIKSDVSKALLEETTKVEQNILK